MTKAARYPPLTLQTTTMMMVAAVTATAKTIKQAAPVPALAPPTAVWHPARRQHERASHRRHQSAAPRKAKLYLRGKHRSLLASGLVGLP